MTDLTYAQFLERAAALDGLDPELHETLYPIVRDLLRMAERVRRIAPELHTDIADDVLSHDARGGE